MSTTVDWSRYPEPLRSIAIDIAAELRRIATEPSPMGAARWSAIDGRKLREQRKALGLTQYRLAKAIGWSASESANCSAPISQWETGNAEPSARAKAAMAQLGIKCR